jgi:hypothetical protein
MSTRVRAKANEKAARERARENVLTRDITKSIPLGLQCKLVSIIVHVEEGGAADGTEGGHPFDWVAIRSLLADPEVREWVAEMTRLGFAPVKRGATVSKSHAYPVDTHRH